MIDPTEPGSDDRRFQQTRKWATEYPGRFLGLPPPHPNCRCQTEPQQPVLERLRDRVLKGEFGGPQDGARRRR